MVEDFLFDGKTGKSFNLYIVNINNSSDETLPVSVDNINGFQPANYDHKIWTSIENDEVLSTTIELIQMENCVPKDMTDYDIERVARWFSREDGYHKFSWIYPNNDGLFYNVKINVSKILIGFRRIGVKFEIITDSKYAWQYIEQTKELISNEDFLMYDYSSGLGEKPLNISLTCKEDGDYLLTHIFNDEKRISKIDLCCKDEIIKISELQVLESSNKDHDISDCFNFIFPKITNNINNNENVYRVNKDCTITISYNQKRKVGI